MSPHKTWVDHRPPDLDLGHGWLGWYVGWHPDRDINPQYAGTPDVDRYCMLLEHPDARNPAVLCASSITFDGPVAQRIDPDRPKWQVASWEPLTVSPSILCTLEKGGCGAHGFIREGRWVAA